MTWRDLPRLPGDDLFDPDAREDIAAPLTLEQIAGLLASPDDRGALRRDGDALVSENGAVFPIMDGRPVLLPQAARRRLKDGAVAVPVEATRDAFDQYLYLNQVKNSGGDPNSPLADPWYLRHLQRSRILLRPARGVVLDVGCDDPALSSRLFPAAVGYVGLEPSLGRNPGMRLVGMAEFLPLKDACVDGVAFLTSLDHVLDYHAAIDEAWRVLKPGGLLYLAALVWTHKAGLHRDNIHFHHFREFELQGVLQPFDIEDITAYAWKGDDHRYGVYLRARKPG